jgi:hypothetical protein
MSDLFVDSCSVGRRRLKMRKLPVIIAATSALWAFPAFAGQVGAPAASEPAVTLAQFDLCVGPDCRYRYYGDRRYDRAYDYDRDYRYRRDEDRRCRDITIRERRGDEVFIRRERRCDY